MKAEQGYLMRNNAYDYIILVGENRNFIITDDRIDEVNTFESYCEWFEENDGYVTEITEEYKNQLLETDEILREL